MDVSIQKCLLPFTTIETYKVLAGILAPHAEKLQPVLFPSYDCRRCTPVNFRFIAGLQVAWDECLRGFDAKSYLGKFHIATYSGFTPFIALLIHQTAIYPVSRMPLLLRFVLVALKPVVDSQHVIAECGKRLMVPFFVSPWLTSYGFLDRVS